MFSLIFLSVIAAFVNGSPLETINRAKRNDLRDQHLPELYWNSPVRLGVYINSDDVFDTGESNKAFKRTMPSNKIHTEGSGSGSGSPLTEPGKRSNVPKPEGEQKSLEQNKPENFQAMKKSELSANVSQVEEMSDDDGTKRSTTITCQGQKDWLQCPMYRLIKINSAFWGRDDTKTCRSAGIEHGLKTGEICAQDESNTMAKVQNACEGESACELVASPVYFDRTDCPDIYKFMRVNWECAHSESRIKETLQEEKEELARHKADQS